MPTSKQTHRIMVCSSLLGHGCCLTHYLSRLVVLLSTNFHLSILTPNCCQIFDIAICHLNSHFKYWPSLKRKTCAFQLVVLCNSSFSTTHGRHHKSINCHSCTMRISWSKHQANMKAWTTSLIAPAEVQVRQGTARQACRSCTNSPIATVASQQACRSCTNSPIATVASQQACRSCTNSPIATVASQQACELL